MLVRSTIVLFTQFVDADLGLASYLIGDEEYVLAVVVDPSYAIEQYLEEAEQEDRVRLVAVLETHARRPPSRARAARVRTACPSTSTPSPPWRTQNEPLVDGQELEFGSVGIRVLHTPGHQPALLLLPRRRADPADG